jgi:hypothetical protein
MCYAAYLGTDRELQLIEWDQRAPAFHVSKAPHQELTVLSKLMEVPYVYQLGSHEGCACGFACGLLEPENDDERAREAASRESLRRMADYVEAAIVRRHPVKFFACWIGDEAEPPTKQETVSVSYFRRAPFEFDEGALLTVLRLAQVK